MKKTNYFEVDFEYKLKMGDTHAMYYHDEFGFDDPLQAFQFVKECKGKACDMWEDEGYINFEITVWYFDGDGCMYNLITLKSKHGTVWE